MKKKSVIKLLASYKKKCMANKTQLGINSAKAMESKLC